MTKKTKAILKTQQKPAATPRVAVAIGEKIYKNGRIQKYVITMADAISGEPIVFELMDKDFRRFRKSWPLIVPRSHDRFLIGETEAYALRDYYELLQKPANDRAKASVPAPVKGRRSAAPHLPDAQKIRRRGNAIPVAANDTSHLVEVDADYIAHHAQPPKERQSKSSFGKAVKIAALGTTALAEMSLTPIPSGPLAMPRPTAIAAAAEAQTHPSGNLFADFQRIYPDACRIETPPAPDRAALRLALTEAHMTQRGPAALAQMKWIREVTRATETVQQNLPRVFAQTRYGSVDAGSYYALRVAAVESVFNTRTVNGNAQGIYHFMPGTWTHVWRSHPEAWHLVGGRIPDQSKRFDPYVATIALHLLVADNYRELSRNLENYVPRLIGTRTSEGRMIDRAYARVLINEVLNNANPYGLHVLGGAGYTRPVVQSIIHPNMPSTAFAQNLAGNRGLYIHRGRVRSVDGQMDELLERISPAIAARFGVATDDNIKAEETRYYRDNPPWMVCDLPKMDDRVTMGGVPATSPASFGR